MRTPSRAARAGRLAFAGLAVAWSAIPIALVIAASFKPPRDIFAVPPSLIFTPTFESYERLWELWPGFFANLRNSLIITAGATLLTVTVSSLAGYVYARYASRLLTLSAFFMIVVRMLPPIIVTLPLFPLINWLRLNDTHLVLILLYATFFVSLGTMIMKTFIDQIPRELDEAAVVDGATAWQTVTRVVLPLAAQGMIAAGVFVFVYAWNEFLFAFIFTTTRAKTAPLVVSEMTGAVDGVEWGVLFAATTLQLVPIVLFVIIAQRYLIAGLTAGATKG
jgi:multiple sugar transport system permease protein